MGYDGGAAATGLWKRAMAALAPATARWRALGAGTRRTAVAAAALIAAAILWSSLSGGETETYRTQPVTIGDVEQTVTALGSIQPKNQVDVGAQVSGQLKDVHVEIGDEVKAGDLLAEIDAKIYETEVQAARARLSDLESQLAGREAELVLAQRQYARNLDLAKIDAVSRNELDTSETQVKTLRASIGSIKAQIEQQRSTVEGGETSLGYARIHAPINGTVVAQPAVKGQTLNATQVAPVVLQIADLETMTVKAQVAEADIGKLHAGMPVYFTTLGHPDNRWESSVRQILPTPDVLNDVVLYKVLIDVDNSDRLLMSEMTAQVFFLLGEARGVTTVPVAALRPVRGEGANVHNVTVVTARGTETRRVETGIASRISAEVLSGLEPGEEVVVGTGEAAARGGGTRRFGGPFL
ncbi:efflux RND transporter periplasmic adaptor subunit [Parvibaculum sp.]|uniref:efflux RND transporter periplasmic adaptor subunit n=1 Tax=Parvibaculum sp. TaxID=2024848 RepID=UPI00260FE870|nr:efflux RND transporter periplasmic adaptor subunit [Parvibaculum sp.]MCW5728758.1 efflux RND transporter periplasmic adaptor subunit [Parvibaculum sp.]